VKPKTVFPGKPARLPGIFQHYDPPLYFVTFCTWKRVAWLDSTELHRAFIAYAERNADRGLTVGRYVLMPDHLHFFVAVPRGYRLSDFVRLLKQQLSGALRAKGHAPPHWQPGFFDHLIRHRESYVEKWHYVQQNPVRAHLVESVEDWPYQGEITRIGAL
jgi:putative transposase